MKKKLAGLAALAAVALVSASAWATPITGTINFAGAEVLFGGSTIADATGVQILGAFSLVGTDDYSTVPFLTPTAFTPFTFNPLSPDPVQPLWTLTVGAGGPTYSFTMTSITIDTQNAHTLSLIGSGLLDITGFDETPGTWHFTTQPNLAGESTDQAILSFSASSAALVPEPGTILLLGTGLLGLALIRGKRQARG